MADIIRIETGEVLLTKEETEEHERKGRNKILISQFFDLSTFVRVQALACTVLILSRFMNTLLVLCLEIEYVLIENLLQWS
jgi:pantothenate kinase